MHINMDWRNSGVSYRDKSPVEPARLEGNAQIQPDFSAFYGAGGQKKRFRSRPREGSWEYQSNEAM